MASKTKEYELCEVNCKKIYKQTPKYTYREVVKQNVACGIYGFGLNNVNYDRINLCKIMFSFGK